MLVFLKASSLRSLTFFQYSRVVVCAACRIIIVAFLSHFFLFGRRDGGVVGLEDVVGVRVGNHHSEDGRGDCVKRSEANCVFSLFEPLRYCCADSPTFVSLLAELTKFDITPRHDCRFRSYACDPRVVQQLRELYMLVL